VKANVTVAGWLKQMLLFPKFVMVAVGDAFTVTLVLLVAVHPCASVIVRSYCPASAAVDDAMVGF